MHMDRSGTFPENFALICLVVSEKMGFTTCTSGQTTHGQWMPMPWQYLCCADVAQSRSKNSTNSCNLKNYPVDEPIPYKSEIQVWHYRFSYQTSWQLASPDWQGYYLQACNHDNSGCRLHWQFSGTVNICHCLNAFMCEADELDKDLIRACATLAKSGRLSVKQF